MCQWTIQYLVVDHHVDGTMCGVGGQLAEVEGLVHDSLPSEGCVAVYQDGHYLGRGGLQSQSVNRQQRGEIRKHMDFLKKGRGFSVYAIFGSLHCDY